MLGPMSESDSDTSVGTNHRRDVGNDRSCDDVGYFALDGEGWQLPDLSLIHI